MKIFCGLALFTVVANTYAVDSVSTACFKDICIGQTLAEVARNPVVKQTYLKTGLPTNQWLTLKKIKEVTELSPICKSSLFWGVIILDANKSIRVDFQNRTTEKGPQWVVTKLSYNAEVEFNDRQVTEFHNDVIKRWGAVPWENDRTQIYVPYRGNPHGIRLLLNGTSARGWVHPSKHDQEFWNSFSDDALKSQAGCGTKEKLSF